MTGPRTKPGRLREEDRAPHQARKRLTRGSGPEANKRTGPAKGWKRSGPRKRTTTRTYKNGSRTQRCPCLGYNRTSNTGPALDHPKRSKRNQTGPARREGSEEDQERQATGKGFGNNDKKGLLCDIDKDVKGFEPPVRDSCSME